MVFMFLCDMTSLLGGKPFPYNKQCRFGHSNIGLFARTSIGRSVAYPLDRFIWLDDLWFNPPPRLSIVRSVAWSFGLSVNRSFDCSIDCMIYC